MDLPPQPPPEQLERFLTLLENESRLWPLFLLMGRTGVRLGQARGSSATEAVVDGMMVSARAWPDHPGWMREFVKLLRSHTPASGA
jgi:putative intracellular protease/amidase